MVLDFRQPRETTSRAPPRPARLPGEASLQPMLCIYGLMTRFWISISSFSWFPSVLVFKHPDLARQTYTHHTHTLDIQTAFPSLIITLHRLHKVHPSCT
jgi:hypothetical protein